MLVSFGKDKEHLPCLIFLWLLCMKLTVELIVLHRSYLVLIGTALTFCSITSV